MKVTLLLILSTINSLTFAGTVAPTPHEAVNISAEAIPDGAAGILVDTSCYGTNNRGTTNPLSPSSRIVVFLSNGTEQLLLDFPSSLASPGGSSTNQDCGVTKITKSTVATLDSSYTIAQILASSSNGGDLVYSALSVDNLNKYNKRSSITCKSSPINFSADFAIDNISEYYAIQVFSGSVSPQSFYGYNGKMDRGTKISIKASTISAGYSDSNKFLSVSAAFPGQDGFCGGYHSPLMFFFKESYPLFTGKSILLKGKDKPTTWVEENHEGYFLVHLRKAEEEITPNKLFGDNGKEKNGFEVLMKLDSNGDKILNKKDKEFKNLYLWKDSNANSKNEKGEVVKLSDMKVESIDLNYNDGYHLDKGAAVYKGRSTFKFLSEDKKVREGEIFDIFFSDK